MAGRSVKRGSLLLVASSLLAGGACSPSTSDSSVVCPTGADPMPMSALPSGRPCFADSGQCNLNVAGECNGVEDPSWANGWTCVCKEEIWECAITSQGAGGCNTLGPYCGSTPPTYG